MSDIAQTYQAALAALRDLIRDPAAKDLRESFDRSAAGEGLTGEALLEVLSRAETGPQGVWLWHFNKIMDRPSFRGAAAARIADRLRPLGPASPPGNCDAAQAFGRDGIVAIPGLVSRTEAEEIVAYLQQCGRLTQRETVLHHDPADVVRAPHVFRIATDERLLAGAYHHLGTTPAIVQMDCWWSLPGSDTPMGAQVFHRDRDDFKACKLFVYLSDVTADDGPHVFIKGSHDEASVRKTLVSKGIDPAKTQAFFAHSGRGLDGVMEPVFGPAVTEITGPPGTCFLENTYGFHRGKIPKHGRRCVFQVLYAVVPYPDRLDIWKKTSLDALPEECAGTPMARAATRFILQQPTSIQEGM